VVGHSRVELGDQVRRVSDRAGDGVRRAGERGRVVFGDRLDDLPQRQALFLSPADQLKSAGAAALLPGVINYRLFR